MEAFSNTELIAAALAIAVAAWVHGALGLGFPLVATPLLAMFTDVRTAILLTLVPTVTINLVSIFTDSHWRQALREFWPLPVATIAGSVVGTQVILRTDPEPFRLLLAAIIVLYLVVDRLRGSGFQPRWRPTYPLMFGTGLIAGILAGLVNVMVPVLIIFALETGVAIGLLVAVFNVSFLTAKVGQILTFGAEGALSRDLLLSAPPLLIIAVLMLLWGIRIRLRTDVERYKRWLKLALWAIAFALVGQHLSA